MKGQYDFICKNSSDRNCTNSNLLSMVKIVSKLIILYTKYFKFDNPKLLNYTHVLKHVLK